ncbi:MAG: hypothetical protein ABI488_24930 [Polyangiaceae bacterium]
MSILRASLIGSALLTSSFAASAMTGEVSFTPTGLRLSVMRITLANVTDEGAVSNEQVLYTCPHDTEEECLVDVTDQTALTALATAAGSAKVDVGTYDTVSMNLCAAGKNGVTPAPGYLRGTFTIASENKTYITSADAADTLGLKELAADDTTAPAFTSIGNWSCNTKSVRLPKPITVSKDTDTDLTVVFDPQLIAFSTPNTSGGMGGCRGQSNGSARGFCVSYPSIVPLVGQDAPDLERFLIAHHRTDPLLIDDAKANAYVVVVRGADMGDPITAFVRPYYSETSASASSNMVQDMDYGGPGYFGETLVSSVSVLPNHAISFTTGGSLDDNSAIFKVFMLEDHKGVVSTRQDGTWQYHAMPWTPTTLDMPTPL